MFSLSQFCVILLMIVAAIVAWRQANKKVTWITWFLITAYWIILTFKNYYDWIGV